MIAIALLISQLYYHHGLDLVRGAKSWHNAITARDVIYTECSLRQKFLSGDAKLEIIYDVDCILFFVCRGKFISNRFKVWRKQIADVNK